MLRNFKKYKFFLEELIKRDFKKKYKQTVLGMIWSMLSPLLMLLVMALVFTQVFGRNTPHYIIYLFCGNLCFNYFSESTKTGMTSLYENSAIFSKVDVPKYMFLLSKNVSSLINFGLSLILFFIFIVADGVVITWCFLLLVYPIICLIVFNIGAGLILSAYYIMFHDIKYLYDILCMIVMYLSAIFYTVEVFSSEVQKLFYINPIYAVISYFRKIVLYAEIPSLSHHLLIAAYSLVLLVVGLVIYKRKNYKFLYYI